MNFAGVKAITTPNGVVKKIQRGDTVLWKSQPEVICSPYVGISFDSVEYMFSVGADRISKFTVTVKGIAPELVQSFGVMMYYYPSFTGTREYTVTVNADFSSTDDTVTSVSKKVEIEITDSMYRYPTFSGFIIYTDLDGSTKRLITARVNAVDEKAEASA